MIDYVGVYNMVTNDLLLVQPSGVYGGQAVNLPMWYRVIGIDNPADAPFETIAQAIAIDVAEAFLIEAYLFTVSASVTLNTIKIFNQFNVLENYEGNADGFLPASGAISGESLPTYDAFGFYTGTKRRDIRSGSRRWPGITEAQQSGGILGEGVFAALEDTCAQMSLTRPVAIPGSGLATIQPVIVGRVKEVNPDTGKVTYRMPSDQAEFRYYSANQWVPRLNTTTQNSRKRGRGI